MANNVETVQIDDQEVTLQENTTGEFSSIIDIQVPQGQTWTFPSDTEHGVEMFIYTHEQFSQSASSTDTHSLSNNLVNSPSRRDVETSSSETQVTGPRSLIVWDDDTAQAFQTGVASVDYSANTFDYTDSDGNTSNLETYYLWGDSAQVEFRSYDRAEENYDKELIKSMREFHEADVYNVNSRITFPESFTLREKEHLKITVKTDVDLTNWNDYDSNNVHSPNSLDTWSYSYFKLPVIKK